MSSKQLRPKARLTRRGRLNPALRRVLTLEVLEDRRMLTVAPLNVALVSDAVAQAQQIQQAAAGGTLAIIYHADTMTTAGLVSLLVSVSASHGGAPIGHLAIVAHGGPGEVDLGTGDDLTLATLRSQAAALEGLRSVLTSDARLDLYSCSVAAGTGGKTFVDELAAETGAAVYASDNPVGTVPGADFVWEYHTGQAAANSGLFSTPELEAIPRLRLASFYIGERIQAASSSSLYVNVRDAAFNVLYQQYVGVHGTIIGEEQGSAGGFTGNWWEINWDSEPPDQNQQPGWSAESTIAPVPAGGDFAEPNFTSSFYTTANHFWNEGDAPASTNPPTPQLGSAMGNCTWYAYGRMLEMGYDPALLAAIVPSGQGNAALWAQNATNANLTGLYVNDTWTVGSIAQSTTNDHVAVVESVNSDGTITVSESSYVNDPTSAWDILWHNRTCSPTWFQNFIHVSKATTSTPLAVTGFTVSPTTLALGNSATISYAVSDVGGPGLRQVELWRAPDANGSPGTWAEVGSPTPIIGYTYSGSFYNVPPSTGTWWYGVHVVDVWGTCRTENDAGLGPTAVTVAPPVLQPPTVAQIPNATPNPVTGTTTNLSVLGADAVYGEASLVYDWELTSLPSGAAAPNFSTNDCNSAKNVTATFKAAGTYDFYVVIIDPAGLSVAGTVDVTVSQTLTTISVDPASATLAAGGTEQFTATGFDQFGDPLTQQGPFSWATTLGAITSAGLLTAPNSPANVTVTATSGTIAGTAVVNVTNLVLGNIGWQYGAPMPQELAGSLGAVYNGNVYIIGGNIGNSSYCYEPSTNSWSTLASTPLPINDGGAAAVGSKIYAVGYWINAVTEIYDPASNTWSTGATMPTPLNYTSVVASGGKVYAIGGRDSGGNIVGTVEAYDPTTNTWASCSPMPTARFGSAAVSLNGLIYVMGGEGTTMSAGTAVEAYNPATDTWTSAPSMPTFRYLAGAAVIGGEICVIGGLGAASQDLASVVAYDPSSDSWQTLPSSLLTPRDSAVVVGVNGLAYAIGGEHIGSGTLSTIEAGSPRYQAIPTIAWPAPAAITYGTALGSAQFDAQANVAGTYAYSWNVGAVPAAGWHTITVAFTPNDTADYTTATATVGFLVNQATPAVSWATPAAITYGTALGSNQLAASASLPAVGVADAVAGTFSYSPAAGTVLGAGNDTLYATFTPADTSDYATATVSVTVTVDKASPTISWATPAQITYGTPLDSTQLNASASWSVGGTLAPVTGTFAYTLPGSTVLGAGSNAIVATFDPSDTNDYTPAAASVTAPVGAAVLTVTANDASRVYGAQDPAYAASFSGFVGGDTLATSVTGSPSLTTTDTAASPVGSYPITAALGTLGASNYTFTFASGSLSVTPATLTVTANNASRVYGASDPTFTAAYSGFVNGDTQGTSISGGPSLTSDDTGASPAGIYSIIAGPGTLAAQNYSFDYVNGTLTVSKAATTTVVTSGNNSSTYGQAVTFTATVTPASGSGETGTVQFQVDGSDVGSPVALSAGSATWTATLLTGGSDTVSATYSGDGINFLGSTTVSNSVINTVAGGDFGGDGGQATAAMLNMPTGVATDSAGDVFIADASNNRIREVNASTGVITTVAGNGNCGYGGDGGQATAAALDVPQAIALDGSGDLFIADTFGYRVQEVDLSTGIITTVAGNGTAGYSGDNAQATAAKINQPCGLAVDTNGHLFIGDSKNNRVREVNLSTGVITTVAGNGTAGYSGDNAQATVAELNTPWGVAVDSVGDLFIADASNNRIREVNLSTGAITTVAGNGTAGYSGDNGKATAAELSSPYGVAVDDNGNLFIAEAGNCRIREVTLSASVINTVAGKGNYGYEGDGGPATAAWLSSVSGVAVDNSGHLLIADFDNNRIREVNLSTGVITTLAGGFLGDNAQATAAGLYYPGGVAVDASGDLFIADSAGNRIREVNLATGVITTIAGNGTEGYSGDGGQATAAGFSVPVGMVLDNNGHLFIADSSDNRVREVNLSTGVITTVAGNGTRGYNGDNGQATAAELDHPCGVALDGNGHLFIADELNNRVREVDLSTGAITTVAGDGVASYGGDSGQATAAELNNPNGVAADASGHLFIADTRNNAIREVTLSTGVITTVAGNGNAGYSTGNGQATAASLNNPDGVAVDSSGHLFIPDNNNQRIREVTLSTGTITTVAGYGPPGDSGDGGAPTAAKLYHPLGIAVDASGDLFVADTFNSRIREITLAGVAAVSVTPATLTVTANSASRVYGAADPAYTATISGLVNGDTLASAVTGSPSLTSNDTSTSPAGSYAITAGLGTLAAQNYSFAFVNGTLTVYSTIAGRDLFYANSTYNGNSDTASSADDAAIDTSKSALLPGETATFANYIGNEHGINGIMVDVAGLANPAALTAADFQFLVGNDSTPSDWTSPAVAPTVTVRAGAGAGGSDRVELIWPDDTIRNEWLQVTVLADANTGLAANDVFYFGAEPGAVMGNGYVSFDDIFAVYRTILAQLPTVTATTVADVNHDGMINFDDIFAVYRAILANNDFTLNMITAPATSAAIPAATAADSTPAAAAPTEAAPIAAASTVSADTASTNDMANSAAVAPAPAAPALPAASAPAVSVVTAGQPADVLPAAASIGPTAALPVLIVDTATVVGAVLPDAPPAVAMPALPPVASLPAASAGTIIPPAAAPAAPEPAVTARTASLDPLPAEFPAAAAGLAPTPPSTDFWIVDVALARTLQWTGDQGDTLLDDY